MGDGQINIRLKDHETNLVYNMMISKEDHYKSLTDDNFANSLLRHAKLHTKGQPEELISGTEAYFGECVNLDEEEQPISSETPGTAKTWTHEDTILIIQAVEAHYDEFNHPKKRKHIWSNVSNDLVSNGINVNATACSQKWKNLMRSYKISKDNIGKTGRGPSRFLFFQEMDKFLGFKNNISSPHTIDSIISTTDDGEADTNVENELKDKTSENSGVKRKNPRTLYFQSKTKFLDVKVQSILDKDKVKNRKLELEERKVKALEELIRMKRIKYQVD